MCDQRLWTEIEPALLSAGIEVLHADITQDSSVEEMAARAVRQIHRAAVLVGFSMGGMVALRIQAVEPERVAGLALIDTNARPDLPERAQMRIEQQLRVRSGLLEEVVRAELLPHYFAVQDMADPRHASLVLEMAADVGPDAFVRQVDAIRCRPDARSGLRFVHCPTIVMGGLEDRLSLPEWQRALASGIPGAEQVLLEGVGHFAPVEAGEAVTTNLLAWGRRRALVPSGTKLRAECKSPTPRKD